VESFFHYTKSRPFGGFWFRKSSVGIDFFFLPNNLGNKLVDQLLAQMEVQLSLLHNQHISNFLEPSGEEQNPWLDDQIF
jgi:hypothetical protein